MILNCNEIESEYRPAASRRAEDLSSLRGRPLSAVEVTKDRFCNNW